MPRKEGDMIVRGKAGKFSTPKSKGVLIPVLLFFVLFSPLRLWPVSSLAFITIILMLTSGKRMEMDTKNSKYRQAINWFGLIKTGKWHKLPPLQSVIINDVSGTQAAYAGIVRIGTATSKKTKVFLKSRKRRNSILVYEGSNYNKALDIANNIKEEYNIRLVNRVK